MPCWQKVTEINKQGTAGNLFKPVIWPSCSCNHLAPPICTIIDSSTCGKGVGD